MNLIIIALAILATVLLGVGAAYVVQHRRELKKRARLMWLAARGRDYRMPNLDPGMISHSTHPDPSRADDPLTAILVRSSEAERRWYALRYLIDQWRSDWMPNMALQHREEQAIDRLLESKYRQAKSDAMGQIADRAEIHSYTADEGFAERYIIEDPTTGFKTQMQMSDRDLIRFEPDPDGDLPPPVRQRTEAFPSTLLRDVEDRMDVEGCRV